MPQVIRSLSARPYLLFVAALVTTALLLGTTDSFSASSLKVISPNGGQSYAVGQSVNIKWAKGNGGSQVKVTLLKGGKGYLVIKKKTANDGKLTWKVPSKVKAGSNYKIKIQSLSDTKVSDTSNKPFKITKAKSTKAKDTKTATFKVTQPKRGKKYKTGKKMAIRWVKGTGTYVKITLLKGKTTTTIHKKTKNDGKHTYTIPSTIKAGKTYKVKICSTKSTKSCATSKAFTIAKGTTSSTIKVTYPNKGEELEQSSTHVIKWNKGNGGKFVKIELTRVVKGKDKGFRTLAKKTKNTGKYSWKIPTTNKYPVGSKYKIKVMAFKGGKTINDLSDKTFSIVAASSGGSTGGGSTGGHDGDATVDEPTGPPPTDEGADVESTITIGTLGLRKFQTDVPFDIKWTTTGAAADNDVCISISNTATRQKHGLYDGTFSTPASKGQVTAKFVNLPIGSYTLSLSVHGDDAPCAQRDLFIVRDDVVIHHVAPALCGNGVVETGEVCDYAGVRCKGPGVASKTFCNGPADDPTTSCARYWFGSTAGGGSSATTCRIFYQREFKEFNFYFDTDGHGARDGNAAGIPKDQLPSVRFRLCDSFEP